MRDKLATELAAPTLSAGGEREADASEAADPAALQAGSVWLFPPLLPNPPNEEGEAGRSLIRGLPAEHLSPVSMRSLCFLSEGVKKAALGKYPRRGGNRRRSGTGRWRPSRIKPHNLQLVVNDGRTLGTGVSFVTTAQPFGPSCVFVSLALTANSPLVHRFRRPAFSHISAAVSMQTSGEILSRLNSCQLFACCATECVLLLTW